MPHTTNIKAFLPNAPSTPILEAYRILVSIELALKDAGFFAGQGGHDIPAMLSMAAQRASGNGQLVLAGQIGAHQAKLRNDLAQLLTTRENGTIQSVPAHSYPHARYTRFAGDWGGVSETLSQAVIDLAQTCHSLLVLLRTNRIALGMNL